MRRPPNLAMEPSESRLDVLEGKARSEALSPEERSEIASRGGKAKWAKRKAEHAPITAGTPLAKYTGMLALAGREIPCYRDGAGLFPRFPDASKG